LGQFVVLAGGDGAHDRGDDLSRQHARLAAQKFAIRRHATASGNSLVVVKDASEVGAFATVRQAWPWSGRQPRGYLGVRYVALTQGVAALDREFPTAVGDTSEPAPPATARQLLEELLPKPRHTSS